MSESSTSPSNAIAIERLCDRFCEALCRGERPRIEDWADRVGPDVDAVIARLALLKLDHCVRAGEPISAAHYFSRFPGLRTDRAIARELVRAEFHAARSRDPGITESMFRERYPDHADAIAGEGSWVTIPQDGTAPFKVIPSETPPDRPVPSADPLAFLAALLQPPDRPDDLGRVDHYRVTGVLGHGGMGSCSAAKTPSCIVRSR